MAAPTIRGATQAAIDNNGAATSPSSTEVGDLVLVFVWSQGTNIPSHTLQSGFTEIRSHSHNDGTTDGRLSVACMVATVAGAQSYQPYAVSGATSGQTAAAILVIAAGTWAAWEDVAGTLAAALWKQNSTTSTGTGAPNPPSVTGLFGDWLVVTMGAWHVTTAASTVTTAPTNYTEQVDGPTGSHVTHLAVSTRALTGLSNATEDPGAYTDNVTPNGTASMTFAIPGTSVPVHLVAANETGAMPTGTQIGDFVFVTLGALGAIGTYTGWTQLGDELTFASGWREKYFYRLWQSGDSMPSWGTTYAAAASYRFVHDSAPIVDQVVALRASGTTPDIGTLTNDAGTGNTAVYWLTGDSFGSHTPPTNYVEAVDGGNDSSAGYRANLSASSTTGGTATTPDSQNAVGHLILRQFLNSVGTSYTLSAEGGSFAESGAAATPRMARSLSAGAASYSWTGALAGLRRGFPLAGEAGSYALAGSAAGLRAARTLAAEAGSGGLAGSPAGLAVGRSLGAAAGSYAQTGSDATLIYSPASGYSLSAEGGSFALAGTAAALRAARRLGPVVGPTYSLHGTAAGLRLAARLEAEAASYTVSGASAGLARGLQLPASSTPYALAGTQAAVRLSRRLVAGPGALALAGSDAGLAYSASSPVLAAQGGAYALSGSPATIRRTHVLPAAPGAYGCAGAAIGLQVGRRLAAAAGVHSLSGQTARLAFGRGVVAAVGAYSLAGAPAALRATRRLLAESGEIDWLGVDAALYAQSWRPQASPGAAAFGAALGASLHGTSLSGSRTGGSLTASRTSTDIVGEGG